MAHPVDLIPTLEDKIVQVAVAEVLSAIYEVDFLGFSHGFRPGRSPHTALAALDRALMTQKVNWVTLPLSLPLPGRPKRSAKR